MNAQAKAMSGTFVPSVDDTRRLRDAFGCFATGVTIVTCNSEDGPICITANSFSSLSLDPALVMWAVDKGSRRFGYFSKATHFAIHVLAADQGALCFASAKDLNALNGLRHDLNPEGTPILPGCLARFECATEAHYEAGDHVIMVGKILRVAKEDGDALAFFAGKIGSFTQAAQT
ncbi:MAG: flavin reductase family protein [Pelagimonas sp.]|jgi:flavin reductase (DIM6/NTAB) family NADH-FMN oxidoreductase RutF|nr:flavin reductase family protein [Pelagimonas sp.]